MPDASGLVVHEARGQTDGLDDLVVDRQTGWRFDSETPSTIDAALTALFAPPPGERQRMGDAGRRVAENVAFRGKTTVTPAFGLGNLPDGLRMCAFDVEKNGPSGPRTSYSLGTCSTQPPVQVRTDEDTGRCEHDESFVATVAVAPVLADVEEFLGGGSPAQV